MPLFGRSPAPAPAPVRDPSFLRCVSALERLSESESLRVRAATQTAQQQAVAGVQKMRDHIETMKKREEHVAKVRVKIPRASGGAHG